MLDHISFYECSKICNTFTIFQVRWQSLQGATAKTVSCAEQFKQRCLSHSQIGLCATANRKGLPDLVPELFQSARIYLQRRDVTDTGARIEYTMVSFSFTIMNTIRDSKALGQSLFATVSVMTFHFASYLTRYRIL